MERRTAAIAIAVAGAMAIGMVSCATRRAARRVDEETRIEAAPSEDAAPAASWRIPEPDGLADELRTHAWEASDGSGATLSVRGGALVERSASGDVRVTAFDVLEESEDGLAVRCIGEGGAVSEHSITVAEADGSMEIGSSAFRLAGSYREAEPMHEVRIEGVTESYLALVGEWQAFAQGVGAYCTLWVPDATRASFFPEVSLDTSTGKVTATLDCDDPASTTVTVVWDGEAFEVSSDGR